MGHHKKRVYRRGGQLTLMRVEVTPLTKYEKYIPVPEEILTAWNKLLQIGDKSRISKTQNLILSELTLAFRGHATPQTIDKINRYFDISRSSIPEVLKKKVA